MLRLATTFALEVNGRTLVAEIVRSLASLFGPESDGVSALVDNAVNNYGAPAADAPGDDTLLSDPVAEAVFVDMNGHRQQAAAF